MNMDLHVHSTFSSDARASMQQQCERAVQLGMQYVCFTDHMDWFTHDRPISFGGLDGYFHEIERMRNMFAGRLMILAGAEFGEPHRHEKKLEQLLQYPFDMVMGSLHGIEDTQGTALVHTAKVDGWPLERTYRAYWNEMEIISQMDGLDVIGHLDLPVRSYHELCVDDAQMRRIMHNLVQHGTLMEINTSVLRKGGFTLMPDVPLLTYYKEAGGTHVTLGSDAHTVKELGKDLNRAAQTADLCGIKLCYIQQHQHKEVEMFGPAAFAMPANF